MVAQCDIPPLLAAKNHITAQLWTRAFGIKPDLGEESNLTVKLEAWAAIEAFGSSIELNQFGRRPDLQWWRLSERKPT
jgi:hypothetical protein